MPDRKPAPPQGVPLAGGAREQRGGEPRNLLSLRAALPDSPRRSLSPRSPQHSPPRSPPRPRSCHRHTAPGFRCGAGERKERERRGCERERGGGGTARHGSEREQSTGRSRRPGAHRARAQCPRLPRPGLSTQHVGHGPESAAPCEAGRLRGPGRAAARHTKSREHRPPPPPGRAYTTGRGCGRPTGCSHAALFFCLSRRPLAPPPPPHLLRETLRRARLRAKQDGDLGPGVVRGRGGGGQLGALDALGAAAFGLGGPGRAGDQGRHARQQGEGRHQQGAEGSRQLHS